MAKKNEVHITPDKNSKLWEVIHNKVLVTHVATQKEAIQVGRTLAKESKAELVIHGKDGKIRKKDSFGNDPNPPKG